MTSKCGCANTGPLTVRCVCVFMCMCVRQREREREFLNSRLQGDSEINQTQLMCVYLP